MWILILVVVVILLLCSKQSKQSSRTYSKEKHKDELRKNRNMNKLTPEGELPVGWVLAYEDFTQKATNEYMFFYNQYSENKYGEVLKKYAALKSLVTYIEDAKRIYVKKGECFLFWFENWLATNEEVQRFVDEMKYMEEHMDELLQHENTLKKLRLDLKTIIQTEPGVKQESLYNRFDPELKNDIRNELYSMADKGTIIREKSGRTYCLFINQK